MEGRVQRTLAATHGERALPARCTHRQRQSQSCRRKWTSAQRQQCATNRVEAACHKRTCVQQRLPDRRHSKRQAAASWVSSNTHAWTRAMLPSANLAGASGAASHNCTSYTHCKTNAHPTRAGAPGAGMLQCLVHQRRDHGLAREKTNKRHTAHKHKCTVSWAHTLVCGARKREGRPRPPTH